MALFAALSPSATQAYLAAERWAVTASGHTGGDGTPITLTWSLVPDGTPIRNGDPSNLIAAFDDLFDVSGAHADLSQRPWFPLIEQSFSRWSQLSGVTFLYEPDDDGERLRDAGGALGFRGDVRLGGSSVDGPGGTLANSSLPDGGDIILDTADTAAFADSTNNYRRLRNVLMHELGHALGLLHIESSTDALLMEPFVSSSIEGPQLDDIRGMQALYGDPFEKTHNGLGNGTAARATSLGILPIEGKLAIGSDAVGGQAVAPMETDFVSMANYADVDFYSFTISAPARLSAALTPLGGVFSQGVEGGPQSIIDATARSNLSLAVFAADGTSLLGLANSAAAGQVETISDVALSNVGTYFMRVTSSSVNVQLYELQLSATAPSSSSPGDYNQDGAVDASDYIVWRSTVAQEGIGLAADGNGDGIVDANDYSVWRANFGKLVQGSAAVAPSSANVPEPPGWSLISTATLIVLVSNRCGRTDQLKVLAIAQPE